MALTAAEAAALRRAAEAAIAWREGVDARPINARAAYPALLAAFGGPLPERSGDPEEVVARLVAAAEPGLIGLPSPRFFGWVTGGSHPAGVAADWLAAAWGQNAPMAAAAPAAAAAEEAAGRWVLELLDLPREAGFGLTTGATMANTVALAAARGALLAREGWDVEARGLYGAPEITVIVGAEAHSTVFAGLRLLGFGAERVVRVAADEEGRMRPERLAAALAQGAGPAIVLAQAGNVSSGAFDPLAEVVEAARERAAWVHVDGAFGLWARACPEVADLAAGAEGAASWATDGHKWLQVPYDCGVVMVHDAEALRRAMAAGASYLPQGAARDPMDFTPELSRRARGFALWATIAALGREGVAEMVARHCRMARRIADGLGRVPGLEVLNRVVLNQVALATEDGDAATRALLGRVQADGRCYPSAGAWRGRAIIRVSVSSDRIGEADADATVEAIAAAWAGLRGAAT
jgi:glutamate/tyrosine decarboxylase-like PLP-dependent enzyme